MVTIAGCLQGLVLHLGWWAGAFLRPRDARAPLRVRRALVLLGGLPVFLVVQLVHMLCLVLDDLLFPRYRRVTVGRAVFITGIPRSGTTALHRALAVDRERYTTLTTWEALFAPSILQRRMVRGLAWVDARLGGYLRRGLAAATQRLTGDLAAVHDVGLDAAEEDYLALLPTGGCFLLLLVFPGARGLQALGHFDTAVAAGRRRRLLAFYERVLQRHLYADGARRVLLSKNAAFGSWVTGLRERFPQARFIICTREPVAALSSQISSVASARALFGTRVDDAGFQALFVDMYAETLQHLADTLAQWPRERVAVVDMADLRSKPEETVRGALAQLDEPVSASLRAGLDALAGGGGGHRHSVDALAVPRATLEERLLPAYQRLRALPHCIRPAS
ncbi:sulfotransferase [Aquisalimonas lutea]|uniref:sulfotransferase n=1 Tax=Aquisalimonas lutea TaxID=1327750 RepID=UPI0025B46C99|nr:sulfotransferase [Aquisalimonas lutea]MDN3516439.1 sulfotransferase [Aquisalimonas lutea]